MNQHPIHNTASDGLDTCEPAARVTKSLLAYGVIAGPMYVLVSLAQAAVRDGFDLGRHQWSLLANGSYGWVQITNFVMTGVMVLAFAAGLRRAIPTGRASRWAPRLVAVFGASMIAAGAFRADPALGFPAGTPDAVAEVSWHGMLHLLAGAIGFSCLVAACFAMARRFDAAGQRGWAALSRVTGAVFLIGFGCVAAGGGAAWANLTFTASVLLVWGYLSALSVHLYRSVGRPAPAN